MGRIACSVVGLVFAYTALSKLRSPRQFHLALRDYRIVKPLGSTATALLAAVTIAAEATAAALLLVPSSSLNTSGAGLALLLVVGFGGALGLDSRREFTNCGCGGGPSHVAIPRWALLARVVVLAVVTLSSLLVDDAAVGRVSEAMVPIVAAPYAVLVYSLALLGHIFEVQRQRLEDRVRSARARMAMESPSGGAA